MCYLKTDYSIHAINSMFHFLFYIMIILQVIFLHFGNHIVFCYMNINSFFHWPVRIFFFTVQPCQAHKASHSVAAYRACVNTLEAWSDSLTVPLHFTGLCCLHVFQVTSALPLFHLKKLWYSPHCVLVVIHGLLSLSLPQQRQQLCSLCRI